MNYTTGEILTFITISTTIVSGLFLGVKYFFERIDEKNKKKQTSQDRAYEAVWKLYEATLKEKDNLEKEIEDLKKGDSLARPTVNRIYQAVRKLARQLEIVDAIVIRDFTDSDLSECLKVIDAVKKEIEILWQKFDELEKTLP